MNKLFEKFCENSSLHGLHYLVNKRKTLPERVFWTILLATAIFMLVTQVLLQLKMLHSSTVIAVVENPHYDLSANEFPAITVCPNINVLDSKVRLLWRSYNLSDKNYSSFRHSVIALSLMRFAHYNLPLDYTNSINGNIYPIKNENIRRIMIEVKPDLDNVMDSCTLKSKHIDCKKLFHPQLLTLEGFCYSFNSKTAVRSTEDQIELPPLKSSNETLFGFRTSMIGVTSGIGFRLKSLSHEILNDTVFGDYYTIIVHNPSLIPDMSKTFSIPSNGSRRNYIGISVSVVEADKSLNDMEESLRDCQFVNSSKVISCSLECRISNILAVCHCLPYYFHHFMMESDVCGLEDLKCLSYLAGFFHRYGVPKGTVGFPDWIHSWDTHCPCLQTCSYIAYTSEHTTGPKQISNKVNRGWTRVDIFYKKFAVKYSRTASYLFRDFIVDFGSFANLLLGFSAVAAVDFFIYIFKFSKTAFIGLGKKKSSSSLIIIRKTKKKNTVSISK